MAIQDNKKLAVLIDADNAQASIIQELLAEASRYGTATIKRAYGDWTTTNLKGWKEVLHKLAIQPVQQFSYTTGKNSDLASNRRTPGYAQAGEHTYRFPACGSQLSLIEIIQVKVGKPIISLIAAEVFKMQVAEMPRHRR